jgi:hypothetical protein
MEQYLGNIWNITYATYETSPMQHSKWNPHAHAHEWMDDAYAHTMQVQYASLTLGCYKVVSSKTFLKSLDPWLAS